MLVFLLGFLFISIIGTLLHFTYDFSNHNKVVALFSAVNESTWEHIKIAVTPFFIWSLVDGYIYGLNPNYFIGKALGLISIILFIPLIFYGYKFIFKKHILIIDILSFYVVILLAQYIGLIFINIKPLPYVCSYISLIIVFMIFGLNFLLTMLPIKNFIFKDPITEEYGLKGHKD